MENGHCYIGSAIDIKKRWCQHRSQLNLGKHPNRYLQNAWNKYGEDVFEFSVLETCFVFILIFREQHYIDSIKPKYNLSRTAGSTLGVKQSEEARAKKALIERGNTKALGYRHTEEARNKISFAGRRKCTEETKEKISLANTGHKYTDEMKAKMSLIKTGIKATNETREKMSLAQRERWKIKKTTSEKE